MSEVALDSQGRLAADVHCVGCDYNLRGLDAGTLCPECGKAIDKTLRGDLLRFADPEWVQRLASGMVLAFMSLGLVVMAVLVGDFALNTSGARAFGAELLGVVFFSFPVLCAFAACWKFSTPEPDRDLVPQGDAVPGANANSLDASPDWRKIARGSAIALVVVFFMLGVGVLVDMASELNYASIGAARKLAWTIVMAGVIASTVGVYSAGRYAAGIATRFPNPALAKYTRFMSINCTLVGVLMTVGLFLINFVPGFDRIFNFLGPASGLPAWVETTFVLTGLATMLGAVVCGVGILVLMTSFLIRLRNAAIDARQVRSSSPAA